MPVLALALGVMGTAVLARWCIREVRRVNAEPEAVREPAAMGPINREALPTLRRDPRTGEYRPG